MISILTDAIPAVLGVEERACCLQLTLRDGNDAGEYASRNGVERDLRLRTRSQPVHHYRKEASE
jgi:hypothetical protein